MSGVIFIVMNRAQHIGLGNEPGTFSEVIHGLRFSLTQGLLVIADSVTIIDLVVVVLLSISEIQCRLPVIRF